MQQIEIYVVGLQPCKLFVEYAFDIRRRLQRPRRQLRRQKIGVARVFCQCLAQKRLAFAVVVGISGVNIIDAVPDCKLQQCARCRTVDLSVRIGGEAHTAEAQKRGLNAEIFHTAQFHGPSAPFRYSFSKAIIHESSEESKSPFSPDEAVCLRREENVIHVQCAYVRYLRSICCGLRSMACMSRCGSGRLETKYEKRAAAQLSLFLGFPAQIGWSDCAVRIVRCSLFIIPWKETPSDAGSAGCQKRRSARFPPQCGPRP